MYDVCAVGNALVDILVPVDDDFLAAQAVTKGGMTLVEEVRAQSLYAATSQKGEIASGGSAANTAAGIASLGGTCAYLGKIGDDAFGHAFRQDLRGQNIHFMNAPAPDLATGRCLVLVTPDAQRSMNTFLGAAAEFGPDDVDAATIEAAAVTYLEGYLFDKDPAQQAFRKAAQRAHAAGRQLALTLSDSFCVTRHRDAFLDLVRRDVDILFANADELKTLYQTSDLAAAVKAVRADTALAVVTKGAQGSLIIAKGRTYEIAAHPPAQLIDTTGAGDLYAAGFLFGHTHKKDLPECGRIGAVAAAEIISHYGPRRQQKLSALL